VTCNGIACGADPEQTVKDCDKGKLMTKPTAVTGMPLGGGGLLPKQKWCCAALVMRRIQFDSGRELFLRKN